MIRSAGDKGVKLIEEKAKTSQLDTAGKISPPGFKKLPNNRNPVPLSE